MSPNDNFKNVTIKKKNEYIILGGSSVGKTSLIRRFCDNIFDHCISPTHGYEFYHKTVTVDEEEISIKLWDTCGQENYWSVAPLYYRRADAALIMYDISNYSTYEQARYWYQELLKYGPADIITVLVGNKCDLEDQRVVNTKVAERFAKLRDMIFFETSAKDNINIQQLFIAVARSTPEAKKEEWRADIIRLSIRDFPVDNSAPTEEKKRRRRFYHRVLRCPWLFQRTGEKSMNEALEDNPTIFYST